MVTILTICFNLKKSVFLPHINLIHMIIATDSDYLLQKHWPIYLCNGTKRILSQIRTAALKIENSSPVINCFPSVTNSEQVTSHHLTFYASQSCVQNSFTRWSSAQGLRKFHP